MAQEFIHPDVAQGQVCPLLIATLTYGFARIGAALKMRVEDLQSKSGWLIRLHEKGGKQHMMPCHHANAGAGIAEDRNGFLFRASRAARRNRACQSAHDPGRCLAHGAQACTRGRHHGADRQSQLSGDRDHGVSCQRRHAGACTVDHACPVKRERCAE